MIFLNKSQSEKFEILLRTKRWTVSLALLFILFVNLTGVRSFLGLLPGYLTVGAIGLFGLAMRAIAKNNKISLWLAHSSFLLDALVIILGIYFHGGLETPWAFGSVIVTFMVAYVLGPEIGLAYAIGISSAMFGMFMLEYLRFIPHFSIYPIQNLYWVDIGYFIDSIAGIFLLHIFMALAVGSLSRLTDNRSIKIIEYAEQLKIQLEKRKSVESEIEMVSMELDKKKEEVERSKKIRDDRDREIEDIQREIDRIKGNNYK